MEYLFYRTAGFGYGYVRTWEKGSKRGQKGVKKGLFRVFRILRSEKFYLYRYSTLHTFGHFGVFWSFWSILMILALFFWDHGSCYSNFEVFPFLSFLTILVKMTVLSKKYQKRSQKVVFRGFRGFPGFGTSKITVFDPFLDTHIPILDIRGRNMENTLPVYAGFGYGYFRTWEKGSKGVQKGGPKPRILDFETSNSMSSWSVFHQKSAIFVFFVIFGHFRQVSVFLWLVLSICPKIPLFGKMSENR